MAARLAAAGLCLMIVAAMLVGAGPSSQPSEQMVKWFAELTDPRHEVRDKAVQDLMGLPADELPALYNLIEKSLPLHPSQLAVVRDVVTEIYTKELEYQRDPANRAFLGLYQPPPPDRNTPAADPINGILVTHRVPGFDAYRMLRNGDILMGIRELGLERFNGFTELAERLQRFRPGQTIHLQILRDGKEMDVPVELRIRPAGVDTYMQLEAWVTIRRSNAETYWESTFGKLLEQNSTGRISNAD